MIQYLLTLILIAITSILVTIRNGDRPSANKPYPAPTLYRTNAPQ